MFPIQNYLPFASFTNPGQLYVSNTSKTEVQSPAHTDQFMLLYDSCHSYIELLLVDLLCVKSCYSFCLKKSLSLPLNIYKYIYVKLSAVSLSFSFLETKKPQQVKNQISKSRGGQSDRETWKQPDDFPKLLHI